MVVAELGTGPGDAVQPLAAVVLDAAGLEDADHGGHVGGRPVDEQVGGHGEDLPAAGERRWCWPARRTPGLTADAAIGPADEPASSISTRALDQLDAQRGEPIAHRCDDLGGLVEQLAGLVRVALERAPGRARTARTANALGWPWARHSSTAARARPSRSSDVP